MATAKEFEELVREVRFVKANQDRWQDTPNRWLVPLTFFTVGLVVNAVFSWTTMQSDAKLLNYRLEQIELKAKAQEHADRQNFEAFKAKAAAIQEERYEELKKKVGQ